VGEHPGRISWSETGYGACGHAYFIAAPAYVDNDEMRSAMRNGPFEAVDHLSSICPGGGVRPENALKKRV